MTRLGFFTRLLEDADAAQRYSYALEQVRHAERHGFDTAWVAQHHFNGAEGGLPSPLVLLAAAAALTDRIRLGTAIVTLPLEDPVRLAEDAAVLDTLSGGRFELGVGSGGTASSFGVFGRRSEDRGRLLGEHLERLRGLLAGPTLYPPAPGLGDRIWQATFSVEGGARAGRAGDGLLLSRTQPRPPDRPRAALAEVQQPIIDAYLDALPANVPPRILASRTLVVGDDRERLLAVSERGLRRAAASLAAAGHRFESDELADLIAGTDTHIGAVEDVVASLSADATLARATDVAFQVHSVDPGHELTLRSIELTASAVAPALGIGTLASV
ncbi:putative FMN-dependent luciferase-like monooxygenase [Rathayibacter sp. YIM 133350]|uniref:putative FMN-dependent luciferase-like monooxygenase n=1 Tax=Rathayibacter sp. YIM 133350 TaxID=3131992 RepID=UPI00307F85DA